MEHIHLSECTSTQDYALDMLKSSENFIISCDSQTQGRGQGGKDWDTLGECVSFSFDLLPANPISLTSLELGVLVVKFFKHFYNVSARLKWPNDILNEFNQKCGGILINNPTGERMIAGIGINLYGDSRIIKKDYRIPAGFLFGNIEKISKEILCFNLVQYIHQNRLTAKEIIEQWNELCGHFNQQVMIFDDESETHGIFTGIGVNGQALIENSKGLMEFYSGSLKLLS